MDRHFEVVTKSGVHYAFGNSCNNIEYEDSHLCFFRHEYDDRKEYITLAAIPYSNIEVILNVEGDGEDL